MKKYTFIFILLLLFISNLFAQKHTLSGYVFDAKSKEFLTNVNIINTQNKNNTLSNSYGYFNISSTDSIIKIRIYKIGYLTKELKINTKNDTLINIELNISPIELTEIQVYSNTINSSQTSTINLEISQLNKLPSFAGEPDLIKSLQLMPGVQSGNEETTGLYIRGGSADQNLILLDGVPLYNISHLFGFLSAFNNDAIKDVKLIKGGFPARYGGRLSSIIDIKMKEGNMQKASVKSSLGLISSKILLETPIIKNKASFLISARRTNFDLIMIPLNAYEKYIWGDNEKKRYYFYDINAKINYKFSSKNRLFFSWYQGKDRYYNKSNDNYIANNISISENNKEEINWGNKVGSIRWNHLIGNNIFSNLTLIYTNYNLNNIYNYSYKEENKSNTQIYKNSINYTSNIQDFGTKYDIDYAINNNYKIKTGVSGTLHKFLPGVSHYKILDNYTNIDTSTSGKIIRTQEYRAYIENEIKINNKINMNIGLHSSIFFVNKKKYNSIEPRTAISYNFISNWAIKMSYAKMQQYLHLLTNSGVGLPTDLWVPTTQNIKPQKSQQATVGIYHKFKKKYIINIEGFYKIMNNLISYKEGASYFINEENWDKKIEKNGKGESYGIEFFIHKKTGKFQGWLAYTLSWTNRQFDNINRGKTYSYKYDRRNDLSISIIYHLNKKITLSTNWVYGTGNAISLPVSISPSIYYPIETNAIYYFTNNVLPISYVSTQSRQASMVVEYGNKNSQRMPAFHRLDIGISSEKRKKKITQKWTLGLYNAYNHKNPFYVRYTFDNDDYNGNANVKGKFQTVTLFPIMPFISYSLEF